MAENAITAVIRVGDGQLAPPCDPVHLARLAVKARTELGVELPDDYAEFLRHADGASVNGLLIYGAAEWKAGPSTVPDLVAINMKRRAVAPDLSKMLVLGEFDDEYLVFTPVSSRYALVDRDGLDAFEESPDMIDLIKSCVEA